MSRKSFYLNKRGDYWYARLVDPETGAILTAKNTGQTDRDMASAVAGNWVLNGNIPKGRIRKTKQLDEELAHAQLFHYLKTLELTTHDASRIVEILKTRNILDKPKQADKKDFITFLLEFYDYEKSPYVREKLAHGHSIGKRHCHDSIKRVECYWKPAFSNRTLSSITRDELRDFSLSLVDRKLSASTINKIIIVGKVALSWAHREGLLAVNPAEKLATFVGRPKVRGILSDEETTKLFQQKWKDERSLIGNQVAATCGLRAGEVLGLRKEDIGLDRLFVRHAWSNLDGLKDPKNGDQRQVPLLPDIREKLLCLVNKNPWDDGFIFYSAVENQPMDQKFLTKGLYSALKKIGITQDFRMERNIVFHSWRHRYAAKMADLVDARSLGLATGHKTQAMLEHYAAHANENHFNAVMKATQKAFMNA
jgi:integrase